MTERRVVEGIKHGASGYRNHGCRCEVCTDEERERNRAYREANRDKERERSRAWREANRDKARERDRARREANRDKERERSRAYREANPWIRKHHHQLRHARKAGVPVYDFNADQLAARLSLFPLCYICGERAWEHIDHVKPKSRGGAHMLANLRGACGMCNTTKNDRWLGTAQLPELLNAIRNLNTLEMAP